jgi:hypothetical protein
MAHWFCGSVEREKNPTPSTRPCNIHEKKSVKDHFVFQSPLEPSLLRKTLQQSNVQVLEVD